MSPDSDQTAIIACIPTDPAALARINSTAPVPIKPYSGSVPGECVSCGGAVAIGPRQAGMMAQTDRQTTVMCLECAGSLIAAFGGARLNHLGNPE